ncbi:MAG: hypothetical protein ACXX52_02745, partial [Candidatus Liberibacter asiaticus]
MLFDNQFIENILKEDREDNNIKSLAQLQRIAIRTVLANRTKNIKSITKEFMEYWIAHSSRAWRTSKPRTYLNLHIA